MVPTFLVETRPSTGSPALSSGRPAARFGFALVLLVGALVACTKSENKPAPNPNPTTPFYGGFGSSGEPGIDGGGSSGASGRDGGSSSGRVPPGTSSGNGPCVAPAQTCGTSCANLQEDPAHCGACGKACPAEQVCAKGECVKVPCGEPYKTCGGACVDLRNDQANCGECGVGCSSAQRCYDGKCSAPCRVGTVYCAGHCEDPRVNARFCGALAGCGVPDPLTAGKDCGSGSCVDGKCKTDCPDDKSSCGKACVDLRSDPSNCGGCGKTCPGGSNCQNGSCCGQGQQSCMGQCVDVLSNNINCGACGNLCEAGTTCMMGQCK
jgi:hypothetical protein